MGTIKSWQFAIVCLTLILNFLGISHLICDFGKLADKLEQIKTACLIPTASCSKYEWLLTTASWRCDTWVSLASIVSSALERLTWGRSEREITQPVPRPLPNLIKPFSLRSPVWFSWIAQLLCSWQAPRSTLIFDQNETKYSVGWKVSALPLVGCLWWIPPHGKGEAQRRCTGP